MNRDTFLEKDVLSFSRAKATDIQIILDGNPAHITMYEAVYVKNPTNVAMVPDEKEDQRFSMYVPDNADQNSPIVLWVKNWGWIVNAYALRHQVEEGKTYSSKAQDDLIGKLMADGYVLVTYGCRSRGDRPTPEGKYISHAPAVVVDTKAVIRYLRLNAGLLPAGDPEHLIVTGLSGGGALSTIIGASGNNAEFFPYLYEIGAAGIVKEGEAYHSTIGDDPFAVIAYCPINDMREADAAYEYTYGQIRQRLVEEGLPVVDPKSGLTFQDPFTDTYTPEWMLEASKELGAQYGAYVDSLKLTADDGSDITSGSLRERMRELLNAGFRKAYLEIGGEQMKMDLAGAAEYSGEKTTCMFHTDSEGWENFFSYDVDGVPYLADQDALFRYLYFVARNQPLKVACAFSNRGLAENGLAYVSGFNEDNLFGTEDQAYCPFEFYSWNHDAVKGNGVGLDDTGMTFDEYLQTDAGEILKRQFAATSPVHYLLNEQDTRSDTCHHWYVRHGLRDRDTGFALQTVLYYALKNNAAVRNLNFAFAWLQPHCGDYDVQEAYQWLEEVLKA